MVSNEIGGAMRVVIAVACALMVSTGAAHAKHLHRIHHHRGHHHHVSRSVRHVRAVASGSDLDARPSDCYGIPWCGCYLRHVFHIADKSLNLARNWAHWGRAVSAPAVGVVVVFPHHVGIIRGKDGSGKWVVESGNDGHRVRTRPRSLAGAIAFREE